jgi:hypothetical protein
MLAEWNIIIGGARKKKEYNVRTEEKSSHARLFSNFIQRFFLVHDGSQTGDRL